VLVRLANPARAETEITVSFERVGGPQREGRVLTVPPQPRYRTVARTSPRIFRPGSYRAVVRTRSGAVLGEVEFEVT
jgi:hypothetical protein